MTSRPPEFPLLLILSLVALSVLLSVAYVLGQRGMFSLPPRSGGDAPADDGDVEPPEGDRSPPAGDALLSEDDRLPPDDEQ